MQAEQLSVLDLPPDNVLGILPRFGISGKDGEVIAQFSNIIDEIRLDQVEAQRAGNGKTGKQLQPNLPISIDVKEIYIEQFHVGDRVKFIDGYRTNWETELATGTISKILDHSFEVLWDGYDAGHIYTKHYIKSKKWWVKVISSPFLENPTKINSFPEISSSSKTHGYVEHYSVIGKNDREYFYKRYVYQDISGKLRHHHISKKQTDAIGAMWRTGASAKEICLALGKAYKSE